MNENINNVNVENQNEENLGNDSTKDEPKTLSFSENLNNDLSSGLHSVIYKKIGAVNINELRISNVFSRFIKDVECADCFTLMDIINCAEAVIKGKELNENAGNLIYSYEHRSIPNKSLSAKLFKNSCCGIYSLLSLHNGMALDIDAAGKSLPAAETKRFIVAKPKKAQKLFESAKRNGINIAKAGEIITTDKILLTRNNDIIASVDRSLFNNNEKISVNLGPEHFNAFLSGYNAVFSLVLCNAVASNNILRFGLGEGIENVFARALGYYSAMTYLKNAPVRFVFTPDNNASVAVGRPTVIDGDYLYLLRVRNDFNGLPDKSHFGQLVYYLNEKKRMGIIKDVLPVGENTGRIINRLCHDSLSFVSMAELPAGCFGVIVSVGRGDSVNGIRLGCFKNN